MKTVLFIPLTARFPPFRLARLTQFLPQKFTSLSLGEKSSTWFKEPIIYDSVPPTQDKLLAEYE